MMTKDFFSIDFSFLAFSDATEKHKRLMSHNDTKATEIELSSVYDSGSGNMHLNK